MNDEQVFELAERNSFQDDSGCWIFKDEGLLDFVFMFQKAEREKIAKWMIEHGYATGHGDTIEDLLKELEWQVAEREREACAKLVETDGLARSDEGLVFIKAAQRIRELSEQASRWCYDNYDIPTQERFQEKFAELVRADEREACAKVAESYEPTCDSCPSGVSNAIRARGIDGAKVGEVGLWGEK